MSYEKVSVFFCFLLLLVLFLAKDVARDFLRQWKKHIILLKLQHEKNIDLPNSGELYCCGLMSDWCEGRANKSKWTQRNYTSLGQCCYFMSCKTSECNFRNKNGIPPNGERMYHCNYDFVARNNDELSVLHGEKLEVHCTPTSELNTDL